MLLPRKWDIDSAASTFGGSVFPSLAVRLLWPMAFGLGFLPPALISCYLYVYVYVLEFTKILEIDGGFKNRH